MNAKGWAITAGLGAAAGAVAVLMMPKSNPTRRLAAKAANKMEDVAWKVGDSISQKIDSMDMYQKPPPSGGGFQCTDNACHSEEV